MGIDDAKGLLLALQIFDDTGQDDVLDDICKISRVIGVTVIHGCACFMPCRFRQGLQWLNAKSLSHCVVRAISLLS
ncbi:hypothetical protein L273_00701 [Brucella abortus B10-0091]|nr:hypothetical protein L273_00701 [Brucella abortus B10-0091]